MVWFRGQLSIVQLQWMVWVSVFIILLISLIPMDGLRQASVYGLLYTGFYAVIVYGNISFLYPRLYQKGYFVAYIISVIIYLVAVGIIRGVVTLNIYNALFAKHPEQLTPKSLFSFIIGGVMIFVLSFVFRIAIAYFVLKQQSEEIIAQKTAAELNLLKSQVQPHFLFNTLNNIYYEAYLEAPRTAALIERLSDMMRYFVDESPKELVSLSTEIQFIENYIALETIRIRYEINLVFTKPQHLQESRIPPMLLMTFVENIFKHGIDKSSPDNQIEIFLRLEAGRLIFSAENTIPQQEFNPSSPGFGIENLRKRLVLLYANDFELKTEKQGDRYVAGLNIALK